ncbi:hypothetical protein GYMLUDRAFT_265772 [Collybiopsis luxurians FD-317 M1]|uniref:Thiaminase-2/PQQC domain-containing protein n=1 Tax=Collybiopsis luxurians FD-317 M1 TaxID=944289 RepID=A0A0D0C1H1_9AGAR|nr:hypothetical protein GYMLUDRAFT_265772 [Collybiopsis luxurians FD-317 M1]
MSNLNFLFDTPSRHSRGYLVSSILYKGITAKFAKDGHKAGKELIAALKSNTEPEDVVIGKLWNEKSNEDVVKAFMSNRLCREAAAGNSEALEAYKRYAVQDYFYLVDWVRFLVLRAAQMSPHDFDLSQVGGTLQSISNDSSYPTDWFVTCLQELQLSSNDFQVERNVAELAYSQYLQNNAHSDDWYNLHVILIGCYWGWCKLALELYSDTKTKTDTIFYKNWILPSVDLADPRNPTFPSSAKQLSKFLDLMAPAQTAPQWARIQELFRISLRLEVGFFNSGFDAVSLNKGAQTGGQLLTDAMRSYTSDALKRKLTGYSYDENQPGPLNHSSIDGTWIQSSQATSYTLGMDFSTEALRQKHGVKALTTLPKSGKLIFSEGTGYVVGLSIQSPTIQGQWCLSQDLQLGTEEVSIEVEPNSQDWKMTVWYIPKTTK